MEIKNKVLTRQLKKTKLDDCEHIDQDKFLKFLALVEDAYESMDSNIYRLERALEISTSELRNFNDTLEERITSEVEKNRDKDQKLLTQSRYAGMGEMIGNIAHQWRQPLSAISSTASGMTLQIELDLASKEDILNSYSKIIEFTNFLTQTIDDFRGYLKEDKEKISFDVIDTFMKSKSIIEAVYKNNDIDLNIKEAKFRSPSFGFSSELAQVFLNILNNAKDALIEHKEKERRVYVDFIDEPLYNTIKIIDNAGGIPEHILNKIFDPYFTTKHKSQGTGIGLYMSKDIVEKNMQGELSVKNVQVTIDNLEYKGASFTISIPKN
ncbi:MAG: HAMP domain-containing sensor histidine kinase [Arcobacteraceae bacterium]|nr:HAMP domain-containing sensor histidine kinase [Arcobacteraceae bacterium]